MRTRQHVVKCYICGVELLKPICVSHVLCDSCKNDQFNKLTGKNVTGKCVICGKPTKVRKLTCCKEHAMQLRIKTFKTTVKKNKKCGGVRFGGGYGKHGWYKGYWCDSSWELAWVIYNLDHKVTFERCKEKFEYEFNGEIRKYNPDFLLSDGTIIEIKGYVTERWLAKMNQFPKNRLLKVIGCNEIKPYLEYVQLKYGIDFISLYSKTKEESLNI